MIIYNITCQVEWVIHDEWLAWLQDEQVASIKSHGLFKEARILRILQVDETEGPTYAIQFHADSIEKYLKYERDFAANENRKITSKWGTRLVYFTSVMEVVQ